MPAGTFTSASNGGSTTRWGWTVGGGIEWAFNQNWSLAGEYRYTDFGNAGDQLHRIPDGFGTALLHTGTGSSHLTVNQATARSQLPLRWSGGGEVLIDQVPYRSDGIAATRRHLHLCARFLCKLHQPAPDLPKEPFEAATVPSLWGRGFMNVSTRPIDTLAQAVQLLRRSKVREGKPFPLGATWDGLGVNFALFSAHATKVELCLFDDERRDRARAHRAAGIYR